MVPGELASGQKSGWSFLQKLGEGDAGEVFLVQSLVDQSTAILKRPLRSVFTTEVLRQANQIAQEGNFLRALRHLRIDYGDVQISFPNVVDTSKPGTEFSDRWFIVISTAPGQDLESLAKSSHHKANLEDSGADGIQKTLSARAVGDGADPGCAIPTLLMLRVLGAILKLFENIHTLPLTAVSADWRGFIWNDVKPEHIFWNPEGRQLTFIDWGNAQPLSLDGTSIDRHYSVINDYQQFFDVFGRFTLENCPGQFHLLEWPDSSVSSLQINQVTSKLKMQVDAQLEVESSKIRSLKHKEGEYLLSRSATMQTWEQLSQVQIEIEKLGELPDWTGTERLGTQLATDLVNQGSRLPFFSICEQIRNLPKVDQQKWGLVLKIASLTPWPGLFETPTQKALLAAMESDWASVMWFLRKPISHETPPAWWHELCGMIRMAQPEIGVDLITPITALNRLVLTLRADAQKEPHPEAVFAGASPMMPMMYTQTENVVAGSTESSESLAKYIRDVIIKRWTEVEPDPPNSGLEYNEFDEKWEIISQLQPAAAKSVTAALEQPKALVRIIMDSWERKEFETARRGLRRLLLWDPDRLRVFQADQAIGRAGHWLEAIRQGPQAEVSLQEFTTRLELRGREMRNQVGASRWLDQFLEAFSRLRKGATPADVLLDFPDLRAEFPWLLEYHPPLIGTISGPVLLMRNPTAPPAPWLIQSNRTGELGEMGEMSLGEPLDNWAPEALGSSARVVRGRLIGNEGKYHEAAIKFMRPGLADYAVPLFQEEAHILALMKEVPGVASAYEMGFIRFRDNGHIKEDHDRGSISGAGGSIIRLCNQNVHQFIADMRMRASEDWLPYLALPVMDRSENLMNLCDAGYTRGRFLPMKQSLRLVIQILGILAIAHSRNIVYRDHKILHFYWVEDENGIKMIDWNVARHHSSGLSPADKSDDLVQFGARAMHHILTGRPAPGALPVGPNKPEEVEQAAKAYTPQWTYDDQRIPTRLKEITERTLVGHYDSVSSLHSELEILFQELPDES